LPFWVRVSDCLIVDLEEWIIRGDWVVNYSIDELVRLGCDLESAREIAKAMARDSSRQYYSLKKHRRLRFTDDDVDKLLLVDGHPFFPPGCRHIRGRK